MAKEIIQERESKTDIAYRLLQKRKKEVSFYELWEGVKKELAKVLTPEEMENIDDDISFFYTNLTLDGRFFQVGGNKWNLKERIEFKEIEKRIEITEFYSEEDSEESEENKEDENDEDSEDDENQDDSYDDSTGSDADIRQYRDLRKNNEDDEEF